MTPHIFGKMHMLKGVARYVFILALLYGSAPAQMQIIELANQEIAKRVAGRVVDPSNAGIPGVLVEDCSSDWKTSLRSTHTDDKGKFHFSRKFGKSVYHLQFRSPGFDWLRITVQLNKDGKQMVLVRLPIAT